MVREKGTPGPAATEAPKGVSRREFLKRLGLLGGGIIVCLHISELEAIGQTRREGFLGAKVPTDFNAFLRIGADGRVTCLTGKIEMGQGPITSLPQMLAEELDVALEAVDIVMGDTDLCPWDAGTFGSLTTRHFGVFLREAAAEAKGALKELAAERLKCPASRIGTENGAVFDRDRPENRVSYGQLTRGKVIEKRLDKVPPLKPAAEYKIMGQSLLRRDARDKVTGRAQYAGDVRLPDMLYAAILRPPAHGAPQETLDVSRAETYPGAKVVRAGDLTAVLHERPDEAVKALGLIRAGFGPSPSKLDDKNIYAHLLENAPAPDIASQRGDLAEGEKLSATIYEQTYYNAYVAHAPMEPHTALARVENGKVTLWVSTQTPFPVQQAVAGALGVRPESVRVITPFVGGGFGGKSASGQAVEAALLSKAVGRPVQVAWSRAEEFFFDTFRPAAVVKIRTGLDKKGDLVLWDYQVHQAGERGCELYYEAPHHREAVYGGWQSGHGGPHPFGIGPWRAPANNTNTYARELHLNLLAEKAGADPLEYRLRHLKDPRMIGVLKAAAQGFGWTPAKAPSGRGWGLACGIDAGTYVASMAEVRVDRETGAIRVDRVVCAQDMGFVVNPEGARLQMEGCITMGLGYTLSEEIRFENGRVLDVNFDTYELPRFSWLPKIETILVKNDDTPPQGGGEPAIVIMGGLVATAVHDATGVGIFQLPMTPARVKDALKGAKFVIPSAG